MNDSKSPEDVDLLSKANTLDQYLSLNPTINTKSPLDTRTSRPATPQEKEAKKRAFLQEIIHLTLVNNGKDDTGDAEKSSNKNDEIGDQAISNSASNSSNTWRVIRYNLTSEFLQKMLNRSLLSQNKKTTNDMSSFTVAYLKDSQDGSIVAPSEMQKLCKAPPSVYYVILAPPNRTKDILTHPTSSTSNSLTSTPAYWYQGDMKFVLRNVPQYSQSETYMVTDKSIQQWVIHSIIADDPSVRRIEQQLKDEDYQHKQLVFQIRKTKTEPMLMGNGTVISNGQRAEQERRIQLENMETKMKALYKTHEQTIKSLRELKRKVSTEISVKATMDSMDEGNNRTSWTLQFFGSLREFHEFVVIQKSNWNASPMYAWRSKDTKKDVFNDSELDHLLLDQHSKRSLFGSTSNYLVDTASVTVERLEHGFGCFQRNVKVTNDITSVDAVTKKWKTFQSHVDVYYGSYEEGKKSGHGMLYTNTKIYGGGFDQDLPSGEGVMMHENGDVWKGEFGHSMNSNNDSKSHNIYARGLPNGLMSVSFSDGAFYEGEVKDGEITGSGVYVSALGDVQEGEFTQGSLVKGKKYFQNTGDSIEGVFPAGLLNGDGVYRSKNKRSIYSGEFLDGEKHGKGNEMYTSCKDELVKQSYNGFFLNGDRSGNGHFEFTDRFDNSIYKVEWELQGRWAIGKPRMGGMITDMKSKYSTPTNNLLSKYRWLHRLKKAEETKDNECKQVMQQDSKIEMEFREAIQQEKGAIFQTYRQSSLEKLQRHDSDDTKDGDQSQEEFHDELPSRSSFYTHHIISNRPKSLLEAKQKPGLSLVLCQSGNADSMLNRLSQKLKAEMIEMGLSYQEIKPIKNVEAVYSNLEEDLGMIDVTQLYQGVHEKFST